MSADRARHADGAREALAQFAASMLEPFGGRPHDLNLRDADQELAALAAAGFEVRPVGERERYYVAEREMAQLIADWRARAEAAERREADLRERMAHIDADFPLVLACDDATQVAGWFTERRATLLTIGAWLAGEPCRCVTPPDEGTCRDCDEVLPEEWCLTCHARQAFAAAAAEAQAEAPADLIDNVPCTTGDAAPSWYCAGDECTAVHPADAVGEGWTAAVTEGRLAVLCPACSEWARREAEGASRTLASVQLPAPGGPTVDVRPRRREAEGGEG